MRMIVLEIAGCGLAKAGGKSFTKLPYSIHKAIDCSLL